MVWQAAQSSEVTGAGPSAAVPELDAVSEPVLLQAAGGPTTVPTVVRVGVGAVAAFLFAAPPPQLFGLWQPLQS